MEEVAKEKKVIDINPITKWRRILSFLADFFINFILAIIFFNLAVYPLGGLIINSSAKYAEYQNNLNDRDAVLYGNNLLFSENGDKTNSSFETNLEYTFEKYLSVYVVDGDSSYEIFKHYSIDICSNNELYLSFFSTYDKEGTYFDINGSTVTLKDAYKEEFSSFYDVNDTPSNKAQTDRENFLSSFFLKSYSLMLTKIYENDLTYNGISYKEMQDAVSAYSSTSDTFIISCTFISYGLASIISYVVFPMITKRRRSISMLFMRFERIDSKTFECLSRGRTLMLAVYGFAMGMLAIMFVPYPIVSFNELFSLGWLFPLSMVSLGLMLISLIMLLIDPFNRDMTDRLTHSVMIDEETLDTIYRSKGYGG